MKALTALDRDGEILKFSNPVYITTGACRKRIGTVVAVMSAIYSSSTVCEVRFNNGDEIRLLSKLMKKVT